MLPGATGQMLSGTLLLSEENAAAGCRLTTWFGGVRKGTVFRTGQRDVGESRLGEASKRHFQGDFRSAHFWRISDCLPSPFGPLMAVSGHSGPGFGMSERRRVADAGASTATPGSRYTACGPEFPRTSLEHLPVMIRFFRGISAPVKSARLVLWRAWARRTGAAVGCRRRAVRRPK